GKKRDSIASARWFSARADDGPVISSREGVSVMMMQDALPGIKRFLKPLTLDPRTMSFVVRMVGAFICHVGRMSATQAAGAIRAEARHRAAVTRFLAKLRWTEDWSQLAVLTALVLETERRTEGIWLFVVDQTYCGQQGQKTENTFSRANYRPRT